MTNNKYNEVLEVNEILTAYASVLTYQMENAYKKWKKDRTEIDIEGIISRFKTDALPETTKTMPAQMIYLDHFYDFHTGTSGTAFQDTNTGEIIIAYTGSNEGIDWLKRQHFSVQNL